MPRIAAILLFVLYTAAAAARVVPPGQPLPPMRVYTAADGMSQTRVSAIAQDRDGYLWLATFRGLNRFDGQRFEALTIRHGLRANMQYALHVARDGDVWAGDGLGGATRIRGDRVVGVVEPAGKATGRVRAIAVVDGYLFRGVEGTGVVSTRLSDGHNSIASLSIVSGERFAMVATDGAALWLSDGTLQRWSPGADAPETLDAGPFIGIEQNARGEVFLLQPDGAMVRWSSGGRERGVVLPASVNASAAAAIDAFGRPWLVMDDALITPLGSRYVHPAGEVTDVFVDREGVVWIGANNGLVRFLGSRFTHIALSAVKRDRVIYAVHEDRNGVLWIGGEAGLMTRTRDGQIRRPDPSLGLPGGRLVALGSDGRGNMLLSYPRKGLYRVPATGSGRAVLVPQTEGTIVPALETDSNGVLWILSVRNGLLRVAPGETQARRIELPTGGSAVTLTSVREGGVVVGIRNVGLVRVSDDGTSVEVIPETTAIDKQLSHISGSSERSIWAVGSGGGVYHLQDGELHRHLEDSELSDQSVYIVEQLQDGTVILGAELGLYQLYPRSDRLYRYGPLEGFLGQETNARASFIDRDNMLWVGTINGVTRMDTRLPMSSLPTLKPRILHVQTDLEQTTLLPGDAVPPEDRGVQIDFVAVSAKMPTGIEYSYRLPGLSDVWSTPDPATNVRYAALPPGEYTFEVRARYGGADWSDVASRVITVTPAFWQTAWFKVAAILCLMMAVPVAVHLRTRRIEQVNAQLKSLVAERTRHIEDANRSLEREVIERKRSEMALSEAEARSRQAFENAPNGMGMATTGARPLRWNPAFASLLWPSELDLPNHLHELIAQHERERFDAFFDDAVSGRAESARAEFCCLGACGDVIHAVWVLSVVRTERDTEPYVLIQVQDVTETRELTDQLRYQASYDELTGLSNRRSFTAALNDVVSNADDAPDAGFLMFMDLDQFKVVNDTSGHAAGDELLRRVAKLVVSCARRDDIVARLGGDEFAVLLPGCETDGARRIAEDVRRSVEELSFSWGSKVFRIGVSIGAVPLAMADDTAELMQIADTACYAAKDAGRNHVHIVEGESDVTADRRGEMLWVQRLTDAMERNRLVLFGQKIAALSDWPGNPEHIEVLVRLRESGSDRFIPPGAFLPAAERYGLSGKLDLWIVQCLLDQLSGTDIDPDNHPRYWVNLSGMTLGDGKFYHQLTNMLSAADLPAGLINFEITETAVIRSVNDANRLLDELRARGCGVALDDFGSGLSSFGYLKEFKVDRIKIDGMFVRDITTDPTDRIFVKSIIDIAHTLGIATVTEFVEDDETLELVRSLGADFAQGFGVHRPQPLESLRTNNAPPLPVQSSHA